MGWAGTHALLSSLACAIPGIMATRSLPSARDRFATMMGAPLMTCSARLTVYVLLISVLVSPDTRVGPIGAQGVVMFALYLGGAVSAMATAWVFKKIGSRGAPLLPFYMEMPSYRMPRLRTVVGAVWDSCKGFLRKVGRIILVVTVALWLLLNLPMPSTAQLRDAGVNPADKTAVTAYVVDHSYAADVGRAIEPVFAPLGFDWRINVGVLASLSAREVFVATLGQVAAAENPDQPAKTLKTMTYTSGPHQGERLFRCADMTEIPMHPEATPDPQVLRWVIPAGTLPLHGRVTEPPDALAALVRDGLVAAIEVETRAVLIRLADGYDWARAGGAVRDALAAALRQPDQWRSADVINDDDLLRGALRDVIDGPAGDYIRSHGGTVTIVSVHNHHAEVRMAGTCAHCPASGVTLQTRLEKDLRTRYPDLVELRATEDSRTASRLLWPSLRRQRHA
ncbi:hypothetical protein Aru02nite_10520 [Actinocatenispora rupis]|uniref:Fe-S cluster biogenesis protein NfuA, 4Fe-4S-binding domain n=1 Tax=Actinocatenispora rupis TaxID=519421 RepID=A0A8J3IWV9_9ACTN|nr:hypothetical protein Aru02nite_10520 [Actinocatenispora rupis]